MDQLVDISDEYMLMNETDSATTVSLPTVTSRPKLTCSDCQVQSILIQSSNTETSFVLSLYNVSTGRIFTSTLIQKTQIRNRFFF